MIRCKQELTPRQIVENSSSSKEKKKKIQKPKFVYLTGEMGQWVGLEFTSSELT